MMAERDADMEPSADALRRIGDEEVTHSTITWPDGTVMKNGVLTKIGPRAIVDDGQVVGMRPEE